MRSCGLRPSRQKESRTSTIGRHVKQYGTVLKKQRSLGKLN
ncbi:unnamed protein product [Angiostrongylus costaricensis]|uniref:Uncharacterized protein n=1 Tax=Angiostrongylus costaricensis TaxID=334426 RepID=A0A0R3PVW3_ANGCS|nr:unnamed protein product [Angiostrongylus costaricensis]